MNKQLLSIFAWLSVGSMFAAHGPALEFKEQTIDDKVGIGYGLAIADVNGDKKQDILLVDAAEVAWYENPSWKKHVISGKLTERDHVCIAAQDIDGDGKAEIAVGAGWNPGDTENSGAVFVLLPPADRTQKWESVQLPHEPTVHRMWWVQDDVGKYSLVVSPLHGRGNKNGAGAGVKLQEYLVPGMPRAKWETRVIEDTMHMTHNLDPIQWDDDRGQEILYGGKEGIMLLDKQGQSWKKTKMVEGGEFLGAGEVRAGRIGSKKFIATIEPMHGTNLVYYTQNRDEKWNRFVLDNNIADGHAIVTGDFLQKREQQIVYGWRGKNKDGKVGVKMFSWDGHHWDSHVIDDNKMACEDLKAADLDGDGWLDVIAAGRATKNVKIYWNKGPQKAATK
ncbi:MAG TPA: FG-GAP-like repeat-containing protein [Verrucomicrobiae bacterium]